MTTINNNIAKLTAFTTESFEGQPIEVTVANNFMVINGNLIPAEAALAFAEFYTANRFNDFNPDTDKHDYKQLHGFLWAMQDIQAAE